MPKAFDEREHVARILNVKLRMQEMGADLLLVADPANIDYLTGYNAQSYSNLQAVLVDLDDEQPHWFGRRMDTGGALSLTYLDQEHVHHYMDDYVDSFEKHPYDVIVDFVRRRKQERKHIALEKSGFFFQPRALESLYDGLPDATFHDARLLVNWVRSIKSKAELNYMHEAAVLTDLGMQAGFNAIQSGRRENEVAAEILYAMTAGTPEIGGFACPPPMMPTGMEFSSTYHTSWSDRRYRAGTSTGFELTGSRFHYSAPLSRTVFLGHPTQAFLDKAAIMIEGLEGLVEGLRSGMTGEEGEKIWRNIAIKQGVDKEARIGYSVGLDYPPGWGEQTVSLRPGDSTVLEENMTIHCIPSLMSDDWGIEISETLVIGERRSEPLSKLPRDVVVKT